MTENFLGLDWGEAKVGVALAHAETRVALPTGILKNGPQLLSELRALIEREGVKTVVIGTAARRGETAHQGKEHALGQRLSAETGVEVVYRDEMFTSRLAQDKRRLLGEKGASGADDAEAAAILLQGWLDRSNSA